MPLTTIVLQYSSDPVSDSTPTWVTVPNDEWSHISYWCGPGQEGDSFDPGGATIRLVNKNRKWEPLFGSNVIDTHQRFRLTLNGTQEGLWFITGLAVEYPAGTEWSEVVVSCGDGSEVLALDNLPSLDPPSAASYEEVVEFDEPWGYWRLGEPEGTKVVVRGRRSRRKYTGKKLYYLTKSTRRRVAVTREEAVGAAGPAGTYKNTPELGEPGGILGDPDTSVRFTAASSEYAQMVVEDADETVNANRITMHAWVKPTSTFGTQMGILGGPIDAGGTSVWRLYLGSTGEVVVGVGTHTATGTDTLPLDQWSFVAAAWDGADASVYVNGVLDVSTGVGGHVIPAAVGTQAWIGRVQLAGVNRYFNGWLDEPAVIEGVLPQARIDALYAAGSARGWPEQTAGTRIADIAAHALWSEAGIQTGGRLVQPAMKHGQGRLEEIVELAHNEGPRTMFFFDNAGDPIYLGHEWQTYAPAYSQVQATFGQAEFGELPVDSLQPDYDHQTFNVVQAAREGGELVEVEDMVASGKRGRRVLDDWADTTLVEDAEVESLAAALLAMFKDPVRVVPEIGVSGFDDARLNKILSLDVGDLIRVNWSGETGARNGHTANILRKEKSLDAGERILRCTYRLGRGFDATEGLWRAGVAGSSEAGTTTVAA